MKTAAVEDRVLEGLGGEPVFTHLSQHESSQHAQMLEGDIEDVADHMLQLFQEMGLA